LNTPFDARVARTSGEGTDSRALHKSPRRPQPPQFLADSQVVMSRHGKGRIYDAVRNNGKNFKIVLDGEGMDFNLWAIPSGAEHDDEAKNRLHGHPNVMAEQSKYMSYGPTLKVAIVKARAGVLSDLPPAPVNAKNAFIVSFEFWMDHDGHLTERFIAWLAQQAQALAGEVEGFAGPATRRRRHERPRAASDAPDRHRAWDATALRS
jgi:hypothetical protein